MLQLPVDFRRHSSAACCGSHQQDNDLTPITDRPRSPSCSVSALGLQSSSRRRSFSVTPKGGLINEGDVVLPPTPDGSESRRSSYNSTADNSAGSGGGSSSADTPVYRVLMIGGPGVGKTALTQQFMTSEFMAAQNTSFGQSVLCITYYTLVAVRRRRRRFRIDPEVRCVGAHPLFGPLSRRGLNTIKPVYDPHRAGWPAQFDSQRL